MRDIVYTSVGDSARLNQHDISNWQSYQAAARHYMSIYGNNMAESTKAFMLTATDDDQIDDVATLFELAAHDRMVYLFACVCKSSTTANSISSEINSRIENNSIFEQWSPVQLGNGCKYLAFARI